MKLKQLQQLIKESFNEINTELDEMARVAKKMTIVNQDAWSATKEKYRGKWISDVMEYVENNPDATQAEVAKAVLGPDAYQQQVNGLFKKLITAGVVSFGDYVQPLIGKAEKTPTAEIEQRHKNAAVKRIYTALLHKEEPAEEDVTLVGPELLQQVKDRIANPKPRGRKVGDSKIAPERDVTTEPGVKVIDDREERVAKKANKEKTLEDAKAAVVNHKNAMKAKAKEFRAATTPEEKAKITDELKDMTRHQKTLEKALDAIEA